MVDLQFDPGVWLVVVLGVHRDDLGCILGSYPVTLGLALVTLNLVTLGLHFTFRLHLGLTFRLTLGLTTSVALECYANEELNERVVNISPTLIGNEAFA